MVVLEAAAPHVSSSRSSGSVLYTSRFVQWHWRWLAGAARGTAPQPKLKGTRPRPLLLPSHSPGERPQSVQFAKRGQATRGPYLREQTDRASANCGFEVRFRACLQTYHENVEEFQGCAPCCNKATLRCSGRVAWCLLLAVTSSGLVARLGVYKISNRALQTS